MPFSEVPRARLFPRMSSQSGLVISALTLVCISQQPRRAKPRCEVQKLQQTGQLHTAAFTCRPHFPCTRETLRQISHVNNQRPLRTGLMSSKNSEGQTKTRKTPCRRFYVCLLLLGETRPETSLPCRLPLPDAESAMQGALLLVATLGSCLAVTYILCSGGVRPDLSDGACFFHATRLPRLL